MASTHDYSRATCTWSGDVNGTTSPSDDTGKPCIVLQINRQLQSTRDRTHSHQFALLQESSASCEATLLYKWQASIEKQFHIGLIPFFITGRGYDIAATRAGACAGPLFVRRELDVEMRGGLKRHAGLLMLTSVLVSVSVSMSMPMPTSISIAVLMCTPMAEARAHL